MVIPTLLPILEVNCLPRLINGDGDEAALLLPQRFQQPIGDNCNPIHSVANVDDVSTGQIFDVNNIGEANGEYEQQRSLTLTRTTTTNTADAIVAVIPPLVPFFEVNNVSQAQANQGHTLEFNYAGQANQEYEQQRGLTMMTTTTTNTAGAIAAVIPTLLPILEVNCLPRLINGDRDEAALLLPQRFQQPIGDDCNPIHSVANVDDISTGQIFDVNNVSKANGEYEQQRSLTLMRTTTTNTADAIVAVIPPPCSFF